MESRDASQMTDQIRKVAEIDPVMAELLAARRAALDAAAAAPPPPPTGDMDVSDGTTGVATDLGVGSPPPAVDIDVSNDTAGAATDLPGADEAINSDAPDDFPMVEEFHDPDQGTLTELAVDSDAASPESVEQPGVPAVDGSGLTEEPGEAEPESEPAAAEPEEDAPWAPGRGHGGGGWGSGRYDDSEGPGGGQGGGDGRGREHGHGRPDEPDVDDLG